jgi:hypothetical protein
VPLDKIAESAMLHIERLVMHGLKLQVGMTEEEAPYSLHAFSAAQHQQPAPGNIGSARKIGGKQSQMSNR